MTVARGRFVRSRNAAVRGNRSGRQRTPESLLATADTYRWDSAETMLFRLVCGGDRLAADLAMLAWPVASPEKPSPTQPV